MKIEQKQNRIYKPQSVYTYAAEECNQVSTELNNLITEGGLTPSAGDLTQVKTAVNNIVDTAANNLQEQIDAITSASDVYDVVGTYADLQAYDTTDVPLNDIIKVLQDNTHNDAATYYRLVEVSGNKVWQYVGQEGPYYTKSEIDTDFALKSELPSVATTQQVGLVKPDNQSTFVGNDGTLTIASNVAAALPLFTFIWADHLLNDASYLRADTFSWQSGSVYTNAYNHLVNDIAGITQSTETIGSYTITYYQANDGHKVVLADQETTVQNIFNESGVAWYYILDTANVRFKLPRSKYAFVGLRDNVGKYVAESLPNIKGDPTYGDDNSEHVKIKAWNPTGCFVAKAVSNTMNSDGVAGAGNTATFDASAASSTYQDDAPVQQRASQMYLYFYVGTFTETAYQETAGLNSELFNSKADTNLSNVTGTSGFRKLIEAYNGSDGSWYKVFAEYDPSTGTFLGNWCEQGGSATVTSASSTIVNLLKPFVDLNYSLLTTSNSAYYANAEANNTALKTSISQITVTNGSHITSEFSWEAKGYIS